MKRFIPQSFGSLTIASRGLITKSHRIQVINTDSYAVIEPKEKDLSSLISIGISCEHATPITPPNSKWKFEGKDVRLLGDHWSYDLGSLAFSTELLESIYLNPSNVITPEKNSKTPINIFGIASQFSRIIIDPNRRLDSPTLCLPRADGIDVEMNQNLTEEDKQERINLLYNPFHSKFSELMNSHKPDLLISIHSFTPSYEGRKRDVEIGVLYDRESDFEIANFIKSEYAKHNYDVRFNEPWSGKDGFMYSATMHANEVSNCDAVMIEYRQDLVVNPEWRVKSIRHLINGLKVYFKKKLQ